MILDRKFLFKHDVDSLSKFPQLMEEIARWLHETRIDYITYSKVSYGPFNDYASMPVWTWQACIIKFESLDDEMLFKLAWL